MIRIIVVDDHELIRRGLRELFQPEDDIEVVGEAHDYTSLRGLLRDTAADVLVLDINLPGRSGLETLTTLPPTPANAEPLRVLVLSQYPASQHGLGALKAGAMGYLTKTEDPERIVEAVRTLAMGRRYVTSDLAHLLLDNVTGARQRALHESLSEREMQVLLMVAKGMRLSQIASTLTLSPKTVSVYRARLLTKLSVTSNAELASYALRHGLIE